MVSLSHKHNGNFRSLKLPKSEIDISPVKRYAEKIQRKFGLELKGIYKDYNMPDNMSCFEVERFLLQDRIRTNVGIHIQHRPLSGLIDGVSMVVYSMRIDSGERVEPVRLELKEFADKLISLNPLILDKIDSSKMDGLSLYHFIWGCACSINPQDIINFCVKREINPDCKEELLKQIAWKRKLESQAGELIGWRTTNHTLQIIQSAFDSHSETIKPSLLDRLRLSTVSYAK